MPLRQNFSIDTRAVALVFLVCVTSPAGLPAADQEKPDQQEVERLWGQRVALLESLAEVRRARVVLQPAVY